MLTKEEVEKRIAGLEAAKAQFIAQAERTVAEIGGRIAERKEMLKELEADEAKPPDLKAVEGGRKGKA